MKKDVRDWMALSLELEDALLDASIFEVYCCPLNSSPFSACLNSRPPEGGYRRFSQFTMPTGEFLEHPICETQQYPLIRRIKETQKNISMTYASLIIWIQK